MATAFKIARVFGILLLLVAIILMFVNTKSENNLPKGFYTPIIALEFIQNPEEVQHFFEVKNVEKYKQDLLLGNNIDFLFMLLYSGLLLCIAIGIYNITTSKTMYFAVCLCVTMCVFDALENLQIANIIQLYKTDDISDYLYRLNIFTWLKWSAIASTFLLFSPFFFKGKIFHKLIGICSISSFGLCITAYFNHGFLNEIFATNVVLVFLLLVIFTFTFKIKTNV